MKRCGLLGKDIQYSKSPQIHNRYYLENSIPINYELFDISEEHIEDFVKSLSNSNIIGFNVTIPYKQTIIKHLNVLQYPADEIGAVNTVAIEMGRLFGYNTDYFGFVKSIEDYNINLSGKKALVLGAGGAAKCICYALKDLNCESITIAARNTEKAKSAFQDRFSVVSMYNSIDLMDYDIIVNCTPIGSINYKDQLPIDFTRLKDKCIVYDLIYNPEKTELLKKAEQLGAFIINGEKMLLYQAYSAADIWISKLYT